jgi:hypothetical protein
MARRIIICCDGTWNTPDERDGGVPVPTNVVRIYNAVADRDKNGVVQTKYYHPGVGTGGSWWDKAIGGGTGRGLDRNIMSAYRELCDQYEPGADIFLFGFSRGAYTVRSLGGLITCCGLLDPRGLKEPEIWSRINRMFDSGYRTKKETRRNWDELDWKFHNERDKKVLIHFLGVWDTVGALGIPDDMALLNLLDELRDHTFHDTVLSPTVTHARHAVALDEMRASFQPTLWTAVAANQDVEQVWFPGVHSDVGGGYRETGLSDGALKWMIDESAKCGLVFNPQMVAQIEPDELDVLHDSCCGVFSVLPTQPRGAPLIRAGRDVHPSAVSRHGNPPIHQCPYRPVRNLGPEPMTLDIFAAQQWNFTGIWLERGTEYTFTASGEWMDSSIKCGPDGTYRDNFQIGEVAQMLGTALGKAEDLFKKVTGYPSADFKFTRRHENFPWFALIGAVANGELDTKGTWTPHESFLIGSEGRSFTPEKSGYFYAYANDAWNTYGNNRGHLELTIKARPKS